MNQITPPSSPRDIYKLLGQTFPFSHLEIDKPTRSLGRHNRPARTDSPMQSHGDANARALRAHFHANDTQCAIDNEDTPRGPNPRS
jgi:hypothetical protein